MTDEQRNLFDELVERTIAALPPALGKMLDEVPVIVDDSPEQALLDELGETEDDALMGLHTGTPLTERGIEGEEAPSEIRLFRVAIVEHAGGWDQPEASERVAAEIRITLLHELGHQFGLDEDDLEELGYE
ncbi:MAG: metallopeptidase family protein [Phycisphaerales bacterium]|jgi:predicted Zn-dependent protease with MMP-like domain